MLDIIFNILAVLIQSLTFSYFFITVTKLIQNNVYRFKDIIIVFIIMIITIIITLSLLKQFFPVNLLIAIIESTLLLKFILKMDIHKSVFVSLITYIAGAIFEIISVYIFMILLNSNSYEFLQSKQISLFIILTSCLLLISFVILVKFMIIKKQNIKIFINNINFSQVQACCIIAISCILPQVIIFILNKYDYSISFLIMNSIQMVIICVFVAIFIKKSADRERALKDLKISELHNKTMVNMVDGVRILKHDYNNIMQALNGYLSTKQYDKMQEHISKLIAECNNLNSLSVISPEIFNEPAIYGIVGAKYFTATDKDIKFEFDIISDIKSISFCMPDLSRILGILLDNAIEATSKLKNGKYIRLEIKYDNRKDADIIRIVNTYDTTIKIDIENIYSKGFSTKEVKSGLGLWEVKKLINKTDNSQIYATIEKNKFVQNIIIEKRIDEIHCF